MPVSIAGGRRGRGRGGQLNYWPGFVDALSTLLLAIIFLISVFTVGQFFLSRELSGRDTVLDRLNRQIAELTDLLSLERSGRRTIEETVTSLQTTLRANEAERARLQSLLDSGGAAQVQADQLNTQLESERQATGRALSQVEILNQQIAAMRRQLAALEEALSASENRDKESQARIADLGEVRADIAGKIGAAGRTHDVTGKARPAAIAIRDQCGALFGIAGDLAFDLARLFRRRRRSEIAARSPARSEPNRTAALPWACHSG